MSSHTTDSVCDLTDASLSNLDRWQRHGLVTNVPGEQHWSTTQLSERRKAILTTAGGTPLLLETAPDVDEICVSLEVIRLSGQGLCVDTFENSTGPLSEAVIRCYDHHLL